MQINPVKLLIEEHITINKMVELINFLHSNSQKIQPEIIEKIVDFFITYVDLCHHGKEEKILFEKLKNKKLSFNDEKVMNELIEEHKTGRKLVSELKSKKSKDAIINTFSKMISLYHMHIEKENQRFFYPAFQYFSKEEKEEILQDFIDFDKKIIHDKYLKIVEDLLLLVK